MALLPPPLGAEGRRGGGKRRWLAVFLPPPLGEGKTARKFFLHAAIAFMALAGMGNAHAAAGICSSTAPNPQRIFNQISYPPNLQVGEVIASVVVDIPISCPANPNTSNPANSGFYLVYEVNPNWKLSPVASGVWTTTVKGIGVRITNITYNIPLDDARCYVSQTLDCFLAPTGLTAVPTASTLPIQLKVELVKIGDITWTTPPSAIVAIRSYDRVLGGTFASTYIANIFFGSTPTFVQSTCTVTMPTISVDLPPVQVSALSSGKPVGNWPFQIDLVCGGGKTVYITMTDATDLGNRSNQLTLSSGSTAGNVKLQIVKSDGTLVNFGPADAAALNSPGQWKVGSSGNPGTTGNNIPIRLTAQYISTGPVTPGKVEAAAMFTLYYQ